MADRVSIIAPDNTVAVNGEGRTIDCTPLTADGVHAVQWDGALGHVEFVNVEGGTFKPNQRIDNIVPYQAYVDAWHALTPPP